MIELSGEYSRMQETFRSLGFGLILATLLIYFLMAALFKSYVTPLVILFAVPLGLVGVVTMLYLTNTAINVQSLLGVIFMVGIVVSNTVLMVDFAQNLRVQEGLGPDQAIRKAASIRARPVLMTALAAFFALIPMALALGPRKRGQCTPGPSRHRRHSGRTDYHAVCRPLSLLARRQGSLLHHCQSMTCGVRPRKATSD